MANAGDKITSWQSLYDAINRVINLPATGSASAFTATTALDNNDVASGNSIDDDDLNNLIDRYNALKTDSLYGSNSQLTSDAHTSSTVSLYSVNPTTVAAGGLLNATSDAEVNNIVNNLNQITCRNIVTCNNASTSTCNRATGYSCTQSYYSSCYRKNSYYYDCSERYYVTYSCRDTVCYKMASCKKACYAYGSGGGVYCGYSSMKSYYCNGWSYYCSNGCNRSYTKTEDCSERYYQECYQYASYSYGCTLSYTCVLCSAQSYSTPCSRGTHNDILCNNTYWGGN